MGAKNNIYNTTLKEELINSFIECCCFTRDVSRGSDNHPQLKNNLLFTTSVVYRLFVCLGGLFEPKRKYTSVFLPVDDISIRAHLYYEDPVPSS